MDDGNIDSNLSAPTTDFFFAPQSPIVDDTITFNANTSFDLDENITSYLWGLEMVTLLVGQWLTTVVQTITL